jgi:uncharacterized SAM-binding protein YcdF (DUF218 family)
VAERARVVAVLGYSAGGAGDELHPICIARLRQAEKIAEGARAVVLSGYARHGGRGEAELMRAAWVGPDLPLVCDTTARSTAGNAAGIAAAARALAADEVVVVTSGWHRLRARALVRSSLRGSAIAVEASSAPGRPSARLAVRELACLAALPAVLLLQRLSTRGHARRTHDLKV